MTKLDTLQNYDRSTSITQNFVEISWILLAQEPSKVAYFTKKYYGEKQSFLFKRIKRLSEDYLLNFDKISSGEPMRTSYEI